jgi:hypothetical protein
MASPPATSAAPAGSVAAEVVPSPLEVVETGLSPLAGDETSATYAAIIRNPNSDAAAVRMQILVDFLDPDQGFVTGQDVAVTVLPGQVTAIGGRAQNAGPATTVHIAPPAELIGFEPNSPADGAFAFTGVTTATSGGRTSTTGTIVSGFPTDESAVQLVAVYRDAAGTIIGGATGGVEAVVAGGSTPFELVDVSPSADIAATEVYWQVTR